MTADEARCLSMLRHASATAEILAGSVTPVMRLLDPGSYRLSIEVPGYEPVERSVTVAAGKTTDVEVSLVAK